MSNPSTPFGFKPIKTVSGQEVTVNYYKVASSASRIGKGDLVALNSSGYIQRESSSVAVGPWVGVAMIDSGTLAAGGISKFPVCDDPAALFEAMSLSSIALTQTSFNQIYKVKCSTAADTNTGLSQDSVTTTLATASNGVRLIALIDDPANESGANQRVVVKINAHYNSPGTAGV